MEAKKIIKINNTKQYLYKVPGGKLLKIKIEINNNRINSIQILGDFFLYPEEALTKIETALTQCEKQQCLSKIKEIIINEKIQLLGFSPEDLNNLIQQGFNENNFKKEQIKNKV